MKWYWWLLTIVFIVLGVSTIIPAPARKPCFLGYYAHCSFTPISTVISFIIAGIVFWYGKKRAEKPK